MLKGSRDFILRGNVVGLAVAVVIGAAFGALVTSFVENLITPLIAAIVGEPDFSNLSFTINSSKFTYGAFLNALISFLAIAAVVYFFVVQPLNALMSRLKPGKPVDVPVRPARSARATSRRPRAAARSAPRRYGPAPAL